MSELVSILLIIAVLIIIVLLVVRPNKFRFNLRLGNDRGLSMEGEKTPPVSQNKKSAHASDPGAVAVGGDADGAEITTNAKSDGDPAPNPPEDGTVTASGPGSVAIGGSARKAKITTNSRQGPRPGPWSP